MLKSIAVSSIAVYFLTGIALANEADDVWINITETSGTQWRAKSGTGSIANFGKKKNNAYHYIYQKSDKINETHQVARLYVELESCKKGYGYIYYNDMQNNYIGMDMFVRFGTTVGDALGTMACTSWDIATGKTSLMDKADSWKVAAVAKQSGNKYSINSNMTRKINYANKPSISILFSYENIAEKKVNYGEYVIHLSDCKQGYGVVYERDFTGKLVSKNDVVLNGDSVLSATATAICSL